MAELNRMSPSPSGSPSRLPRFLPPLEVSVIKPPDLKPPGNLSPSKRSSCSRGASPLPRKGPANKRSPLSPANAITCSSPKASAKTPRARSSSPFRIPVHIPSPKSGISPSKRSSPCPSVSPSRRISLTRLAKDSSFYVKRCIEDEKENATAADQGSNDQPEEHQETNQPELKDSLIYVENSSSRSSAPETSDSDDSLEKRQDTEPKEKEDITTSALTDLSPTPLRSSTNVPSYYLDSQTRTPLWEKVDASSAQTVSSILKPKRVSLVLPQREEEPPLSSITTTAQQNLARQDSLSEHSGLYADARMDESDANTGESPSSFFTAAEVSSRRTRDSIAPPSNNVLLQESDSEYLDFLEEKDKLMAQLNESYELTKEEEEDIDNTKDYDDAEENDTSVQSSSESVGSATGSVAAVLSITTSVEESALNEEEALAKRQEIKALVRQVVPEDMAFFDGMMLHFQGREEELIETLRTMQIRAEMTTCRAEEEDKDDNNENEEEASSHIGSIDTSHELPVAALAQGASIIENNGSESEKTMVDSNQSSQSAIDVEHEDDLQPPTKSTESSHLEPELEENEIQELDFSGTSPLPDSDKLRLVVEVLFFIYCNSTLQEGRRRSLPLLSASEPSISRRASNYGAMVVYSKEQSPGTPTHQRSSSQPITEILTMDPEMQYGIALFQLLVLKHHAVNSEQKSDLKKQKHYLEHMVKTLELCLTLRDETSASSIRMEIAQAQDTLGWLHKDFFQDFPQSFLYYTQALETKSHIYGSDAKNLDLAGSMETLGILMRDKLGCVTDSVRCFTEALNMKKHVYERHPCYLPVNNKPTNCARQYAEMAQTYHSLGLAYDMSADYDNAYSYYEKALASRKLQQQHHLRKMGYTSNQVRRKRQALAKTKKQLIATLFNLGCVSEKLNKLEEARANLEEVLQMQYDLHTPLKGKASRDSANGLIGTLFRLASIYEKCKELEGAQKYFKIALDVHYQIEKSSEGKNSTHHPLLIALLYGAANTSNLLGHYEDSLFAYESLMGTLRKQNVKDKRLLIPTLHHLGLLNDVLGNVAKASKYYRWALEMLNTQENLKESAAATNIRMNVLCLAEPLSEDPKLRLPVQGKSTNLAVYDSVRKYYANSMTRIYKRQDYVHRDAAMAITYRNAALVSATHIRNYTDAHNQYEQFLETVWYHCRDADPTLSPNSSTSNNPLVATRAVVVSQVLYSLGLVEQKSRHYDAARHYQKEGLSLLAKAKKQQLCGMCPTPSGHDTKRMSNLQTAMSREFQQLNSGCKWVSWMRD